MINNTEQKENRLKKFEKGISAVSFDKKISKKIKKDQKRSKRIKKDQKDQICIWKL